MTSEPTASFSQTERRSRYAIFGLLAVGGVSLDLLTKHYIFAWRGWARFGEVRWLFDQHLGIETSVNHGALFGLGSGYRLGFVLLSFIALAVIGYVVLVRSQPLDRWLTVALGLVTGGILGNLYDRLGLWHTAETPGFAKYGVRDWILFRYESIPLFNPWPNFNIADCCLVVGACLLALHSLWGDVKVDGKASTASSGAKPS